MTCNIYNWESEYSEPTPYRHTWSHTTWRASDLDNAIPAYARLIACSDLSDLDEQYRVWSINTSELGSMIAAQVAAGVKRDHDYDRAIVALHELVQHKRAHAYDLWARRDVLESAAFGEHLRARYGGSYSGRARMELDAHLRVIQAREHLRQAACAALTVIRQRMFERARAESDRAASLDDARQRMFAQGPWSVGRYHSSRSDEIESMAEAVKSQGLVPYGVELELDVDISADTAALPANWFAEFDSSLGVSGVELISRPMSADQLRRSLSDLDTVLATASARYPKQGYGLHVTIDLDAVPDERADRLINEVNSGRWTDVARRDDRRYAPLVPGETSLKDVASSNIGKYRAVNYRKDRIVELRLFASRSPQEIAEVISSIDNLLSGGRS